MGVTGRGHFKSSPDPVDSPPADDARGCRCFDYGQTVKRGAESPRALVGGLYLMDARTGPLLSNIEDCKINENFKNKLKA